MLEEIKILSSRRAYEFRQDDLRLTMLSTKMVQQQFQELFQFQASMMGSPSPTFGDVPATYPPGFVFDMGVWVSPEQQPVPIRFLHFEQRRIVIDVAGSSESITAIFEQVKSFFSALHAPDGSPVIGEPELVLDYSEITARYPFSLDRVIAEPVRKLLQDALPEKVDTSHILVPTFSVQVYSVDKELTNVPSLNEIRALSFALRAGTRPQDRIYFSSGPFDSETHLRYLHELSASL
jgi:hypothetical protein